MARIKRPPGYYTRERFRSKGVHNKWRMRAFAMAAMRTRRNPNGTRKSWRQIGMKFGVDPGNACKSVKLHNARVGKNADGDPLECQAKKSTRGNCELTHSVTAAMVAPSATNEGLGP